MTPTPAVVRTAQFVMASLVALVLIVSFDRARRGEFDFHHFYLDVQYFCDHRVLNPDLDNPDPALRRQLPFYLPSVTVWLAPLLCLDRMTAAIRWSVMQAAAFAYCLYAITQWASARDRPAATTRLALACLLALPAIFEAAKFNQLSFAVLALVLAGLHYDERGKPWSAGCWFGLAIVLKLLPAVFVMWLVLRRRWPTVAATLFAALAFDVVPCVSQFGPKATVDYHIEWWNNNVRGAAARGLVDPHLREHFIDHRNESIGAVVARLFWADHPFRLPISSIALSPEDCARIAYVVAIILALLLTWLTLFRGDASVRRRRGEFSVYALAMLVFSPLLRQYYLVWALPALALFVSDAASSVDGANRRRGCIGCVVWIAGMVLWTSETARAAGAHLIMLIAMGALLLVTQPEVSVNSVISGRQLNRTGQR